LQAKIGEEEVEAIENDFVKLCLLWAYKALV